MSLNTPISQTRSDPSLFNTDASTSRANPSESSGASFADLLERSRGFGSGSGNTANNTANNTAGNGGSLNSNTNALRSEASMLAPLSMPMPGLSMPPSSAQAQSLPSPAMKAAAAPAPWMGRAEFGTPSPSPAMSAPPPPGAPSPSAVKQPPSNSGAKPPAAPASNPRANENKADTSEAAAPTTAASGKSDKDKDDDGTDASTGAPPAGTALIPAPLLQSGGPSNPAGAQADAADASQGAEGRARAASLGTSQADGLATGDATAALGAQGAGKGGAALEAAGGEKASSKAGDKGRVELRGALSASDADKANAAKNSAAGGLNSLGLGEAVAGGAAKSEQAGGTGNFASLLQAAGKTGAGGAQGLQDPAAKAPANTPATNYEIQQGLYSPGFASEMAAKLSVAAKDGIQQAHLQLHPAEMGPVEVQIVLNGNQAQVSFVADQADTRQVLQQSLPDLAGALREQGLTLSGGGVFSQSQQQDRGQNPSRDTPAWNARSSASSADSSSLQPLGATAAPRSASRGVLDTFA